MYRSYVNQIELPRLICNQNKGSIRREQLLDVQLVAPGKGATSFGIRVGIGSLRIHTVW